VKTELLLPARYQAPELVARGGMGEVYCAMDTSLGRAVAIKVLDERLASDETLRKRFEREALTAARLSSEAGIVTIFDVGEWDGRPFIVMEYVRGQSLQDVLRREGPQRPADALRWLEQSARALDHAHQRGVVHRDVKPSNLLLDEQGRIHVADFGVASAAGLDSLTQTGMVIGTAGYLSPEQAQGRPATSASDRYALGVVAFELLAGKRPFEKENPTAEAAAHINAPVPSISERARGIPPDVDRVFARALAKDPQDRYGSCQRFVAALRSAFEDAAATTRVVAPPRVTARRRRVWPVLLTLLALAGVAAGIVLATHRDANAPKAGRPVTITQQGTTVVQTVTAQQPTVAAQQPTAAPDGATLASEGYSKMQAGDYAGALPLLEQAAQNLTGTGSLDEAYNDYNLAYTLAQTQGCSGRVLQLLDASQGIQGHRSEINKLRASCQKSG
jgi:predicted Ser/Thr protein kinase/antitoxin (DNA-binding transcriptional repressor) of toxin-antitoxin stability system